MKPLSTLKVGNRYTIIRFGEMGFLHHRKIELVQYKVEAFAQYPESEVLIFKEKSKRHLAGTRFLPHDDFLVYEGWVDVNTEMFVETDISPTGMTCRRSLLSFDREYFEIAKRSVPKAPILEQITSCDATNTREIRESGNKAV